jgi:trimethylamine--corrinoid protein Co-methyltransferase
VRAYAEWSTREERECIIDEALGLLERIGMRFGRGDAIEALAAAGASVDRQEGVARIPRRIVLAALRSCPRSITLGGATPQDDCVLQDGASHFVNSGAPPATLDHETQERRPSTVADLRDATRVLDEMSMVDIVWAIVACTDCSNERRLLTELAVSLANTRKHVQHEVEGRWQVEPLKRMAEATGGDLRKRPRVSVVCCTASPLLAHAELLDASTDLAKAGIPVVVYPMPIAGGTAPITVAGAVTMNIAEFLGAATAILVQCPGAPLLMGAGTSMLDMRTTAYCLGSPETGLMSAVCVEVAHDLGVACLAPALSTDAKYPGIQAAYEKALKGLLVATTLPDLMTGGIGVLDGAGLLSLPQIVIDDEIAQMIQRIRRGPEISHETIMSDAIERVGFTGNYLVERETRRRLRAGEQFMPSIGTRSSYDHWRVAGKPELEIATTRVREILARAEERGPLLSDDQALELDACIEAGAALSPSMTSS